jgi:hypothetical protein
MYIANTFYIVIQYSMTHLGELVDVWVDGCFYLGDIFPHLAFKMCKSLETI